MWRARPSMQSALLWVFLACCVTTSLLVWRKESVGARLQDVARLDREAQRIERALLDRFALHENLLRAGSALLAAKPRPSRLDWRIFTRALDLERHYGGIDGLVINAYVPAGQLPDFVGRMRATLDEGFHVFPQSALADHFVITHIEPIEKAGRALGYDIGSEPVRRAAAEAARDTGRAVLSPPLRLITPGGSGRDYLHILPVYAGGAAPAEVEARRAGLVGWISAGYNSLRFVDSILGPPGAYLRVRLHDGVEPIYDSAADGEVAPSDAPLTIVRPLAVGGREWRLSVTSTAAFDEAGAQSAATLALIAGLGLSLATWYAASLLLKGRSQALELADRRGAELAESEHRYREIFLRAKVAELLIDPVDGRIVEANDAAVEWYGWPREELVGKPITEINTLSPEEVGGEMQAARQEKRNHFLFRHRLASGAVRDVEVHSGPLQIGGRVLLYSIVHDITDRRHAETALKDSFSKLANANRELEQFAYVASHDLQEPLRMVTSYLQLLRRRYGGKLDGDADEYIRFAVDGALRMRELIMDLLEYSRIGRTGNPIVAISLAKVIEPAIRNLEVAIREAGAVVEVQPDLPTVSVDELEMSRVFQNLIGNAIKYHAPGRPPCVALSCRRDGREWIVSVADNGIGVEPEYHDRIFQIFQRLHGRNEYSGTGIGLAIAKKVIERHQGRIWLDSRPGEGSVFHIALPVVQVESVEPGLPSGGDAR
ncbi:MAG: CHASE domain-containing protein [Alphaproteobacteria bacterium]|nr:CHASE domain-containing protein [Alphaproteobacteria bacterium]